MITSSVLGSRFSVLGSRFSVLSLCLVLCACSGGNMGSAFSTGSATNPGSASNTGSVSEETKQTVEDYKTRWDNQVRSVQEVVTVLERYVKADARTVQAKSIGPTDKAKFTQERLQTLVGQTFTGRVNETAFRADIDRIIKKFEREDKALRPSMGAVLAVDPGVTLTQEGNLIMKSGEVVDTSSLMGVANAVVMNAKARGEDPGVAVDYLRAEMQKKMKENPPLMFVWENEASKALAPSSNLATIQSLYLHCPSWSPFMAQGDNCMHWNGSIPYVFDGELGDPSDKVLMKAVEDAMQEWTRVTGGRATFHRADESELLRGKLFLKGVVNIGKRNGGTSSSLVGYGLGLRELKIGDEVLYEPKPWKRDLLVKSHTRHELGHVIGLLHEHQRWDRDLYVEIPPKYRDGQDNYNNYVKKYDLDSSIGWHQLVFEPQTVYFSYFTCWGGLFNLTCGWRQGSFTSWYPVWKYVEVKRERTGYGSLGFDCHSIMLYDGLPIKPFSLPANCVQNITDGPTNDTGNIIGRVTKLNVEISPQDAEAATGLIGW